MNNEELIINLLYKMDARLEALDERMEAFDTRLEALDARLEALEERMAALDARLEALEYRVESLDGRVDSLESRMDRTEALLLVILQRVEENSNEIRRIGLTLENVTNKKITALFDGRDFCLLHQKEFQHTSETVEKHEIRIFALEHRV